MVLRMTRMRVRRLELQLSQRALAERAHVANSDYSRFETRMATPYQAQAERIAQVLELPADRLLDLITLICTEQPDNRESLNAVVR